MLDQFGLGLPNWTRPLAVLGIFLIQLFQNWTACSPIIYTNPQKFSLVTKGKQDSQFEQFTDVLAKKANY